MTLPLPDIRRVIPRWRDSRTALITGELVLPRKNLAEPISVDKDFQEKKQFWNENHRLEYAAEFVASALSLGVINDALDAAEFIIENESKTTSTVLAIAEELLIRAGKRGAKDRTESIPEIIDVNGFYSRVHNIRLAINQFPRNSLLWVDLSHAYVILGQLQKSRDSMLKALFLAPDNRFVLRSASRLFIHLDEPDYAHKILINREVTRHDPWLLAAEIATAAVADRTSNLIRHSRNILESGVFQPYHTAELASALATLELFKGSFRNARRLFHTSLIKPTENSVAQSLWAKQSLTTLEIGNVINNTPRTYEAQVWNSFFLLDWKQLINSAAIWLADEPYSSRPAEFASYAAAIGFDDFKTSEKFSRIGLIANRSDYTLINNLAFSLAQQNRTDEALEVIRNISRPAPVTAIDIALEATEGLIYIRRGDIEKGKAKYLNAITLARHNSLPKIQALASIYYVQEMLRIHELDYSGALTFAEEASKRASTPDVNFLFQKLRLLSKDSGPGLAK